MLGTKLTLREQKYNNNNYLIEKCGRQQLVDNHFSFYFTFTQIASQAWSLPWSVIGF